MKKIKLDKLAVAIVMFIVCITLVSVMLMQFKTVEETDITEIENMRETELRTAISEWKTKYEEVETKLQDTNKKINEYSDKIKNNEKVSELISDELDESNMAVGKTDVYGEGVIVTLNDDEKDIVAWDLIDLVNELKYAGAEAISINDQRVVSTTSLTCEGNIININGEKISSPFVIKAIGSSIYMNSALTRAGGTIEYLNRYIQASVKTSNNITIGKYTGVLNPKYIKYTE